MEVGVLVGTGQVFRSVVPQMRVPSEQVAQIDVPHIPAQDGVSVGVGVGISQETISFHVHTGVEVEIAAEAHC